MAASRRKFLKVAAVGGALAGAPAIVRAQQATTWRAQTLWSAAELTHKCFEDFCERVKAASNGRLVIQPFAAGSVTGVFESLDAVTAGGVRAQAPPAGASASQGAGPPVGHRVRFRSPHPRQGEGSVFFPRGRR